jgi:hypothetical protein
MDTQKYVDGLFAGYEETPALADFKEELRGNLDEKIKNLIKKGMAEQTAFQRATAELSDITTLAEEISLKRKQEVYGDMYMGTRKYMTPRRTALFVLGGALICFGLITGAVAWFSTGLEMVFLGGVMVFCVAGVALLTFMGLTQETAAKYPMAKKRASLYTIAVGVFTFGVFVVLITYFAVAMREHSTTPFPAELGYMSTDLELMSSVATLIPFALPAAALFAYLILTEKDRHKPWVVEMVMKRIRREAEYFASPAREMQFGLLCGAICVAALALFVILTIKIGILYSWLSLAGAVVVQLLTQALFVTKAKK